MYLGEHSLFHRPRSLRLCSIHRVRRANNQRISYFSKKKKQEEEEEKSSLDPETHEASPTSMHSAADSVQAIQKTLESYVRPREEAEHIWKILTLHLRSCYENGPKASPLALADSDCIIKSTSEVRGLQREYLKALHANIKAQREYEAVSEQARADRPSAPGIFTSDANRLEEHITNLKLRKKQEKLDALEKYLDILSQKPAAAPEFLQPEEIFKDARRLPEVPKTVVSSFTVDKDSTKTDLKALVDRLEKSVLRSKILLRKEEQLLEEVKARSTATPGKISNGAKLSALNATRNELINWMETELCNTSAAEESHPHEVDSNRRGRGKVDKQHMDGQLALIKDTYAQYIAARIALIQIVGQNSLPFFELPKSMQNAVKSRKLEPDSCDHFLAPYFENLLAIAQNQKTSITQKSHLRSVLAKQRGDTGIALNRLAEESQLLPDHQARAGPREGISNQAGQPVLEITKQVQPWVSAADAAKLATLEAVAEKIEDGQIALERSTKYLAEIDQLLGRNQGEELTDDESTIDDVWLAETETPKKETITHVKWNSEAARQRKDVWQTIDGSLGLINAEDLPRK